MTDRPPPSPTSAESEPTWLNPATIKGAILVGVAVLFLFFPSGSALVLRRGFGVALILFGISDLWTYFAGHDHGRPPYRLFAALIAIATGIGMIFWPTEARRIIELVLAIYLILQGLNIISRAFLGNGQDGYAAPQIRGLIYGGLGVAMFFAGDFILDTFLVVGADWP